VKSRATSVRRCADAVGFVIVLGGESSTLVASSRRMPADRDAVIVALYQEGVPVARIAVRAGVCVKTVRNVARRAGLPPRHHPHPERDAAIVRAYQAGQPVERIADLYAVSRPRVRYIAARNEYVGCPNRPVTMLNLSEDAKARQLPRGPAAEARVFSKRLVKALGRHGIVPRKTASMELSAEASHQPAEWLGVLDGDGSAGIYGDSRAPKLSFAGSEALMTQCEHFWREQLGIQGPRPSARPHAKSIWVFDLCCAKAERAAHVLLDASPASMRRKRAVLTQIAGRTA